jgi:magnesium transporter
VSAAAGFVITVRHGRHSELTGCGREAGGAADRLRDGPGIVLHAVCDHVVDTYLDVARPGPVRHRSDRGRDVQRGWRNIERV